MTYPEAVRFLYRLVNHERTLNYKYENAFKLDRVHYMLRALGDPHKSFPSVPRERVPLRPWWPLCSGGRVTR